MPNVSTYVRTEDLSKYLAIVKEKGAWTEFIHNALNQPKSMNINVHPEFMAPEVKEQLIKTPAQAKKAVESLPKDPSWAGPMWKKK